MRSTATHVGDSIREGDRLLRPIFTNARVAAHPAQAPRDASVVARLACESPGVVSPNRARLTGPRGSGAWVGALGCQLWLAGSSVEGAVCAAGGSLPGMSLAFALMAAINGSTGSCATLSHGLERPHQTSPASARRQRRFSLLKGGGARGRQGHCRINLAEPRFVVATSQATPRGGTGLVGKPENTAGFSASLRSDLGQRRRRASDGCALLTTPLIYATASRHCDRDPRAAHTTKESVGLATV